MKHNHYLSTKQIREMLNLKIAGETNEAIHKKMGIATSTVQRLNTWRQHDPDRFKEYLQKIANFENGIRTPRVPQNKHAIVHVPKPHQHERGRYASKETMREQEAEAKRLRAEGLTLNQVAERMQIPKSTLSWRLYGNKQYPKSRRDKGASNGNIVHTSNNGDAGSTPSKNVLLGYAFCKVEQYVRLLAERTGLSEEFLKQRLPELLGHSEMRRGPSGSID